ncbi:AGAP005503-PA [Anopheles gambiae str. PEST]|uniref:AGAP005503-PA n=1 Tax=Anopheles gambiae TaxID=7165 RepID=Q7Q752_ANOGA|nr:AGAP005503-PA [Anopheles gambiae str. PEST]
MDRWTGRVAVVTGASSGIGAAVVKSLANAGMIVIGLARRVERVEELRQQLSEQAAQRLHAIRCDVTREEDIVAAFDQIEQQYGGVDVLINNAGIARGGINLFTPGNTDPLRQVLNTNVMGVVLCSREAFQSMKRRSVDGHIVQVNSVVGHTVPAFASFNIYPASKFAVTALTESMRHELRIEGTRIKVTSISPGLVRTEAVPSELKTGQTPILEPEDIADAVLYVLGTPPRVQVHELTIRPVGEMM